MSCNIYKTGIYQIKNKINNKKYIGSTRVTGHKFPCRNGFFKRWTTHKNSLNNNSHRNYHLQNAWNKYGEQNFEFEILSLCPPEYCFKLEQWFVDNLKPEYNIKLIIQGRNSYKWTDEQRKNASIKRKNLKLSETGRISNRDKRRIHPNLKYTSIDTVKYIKLLLTQNKSCKEISTITNIGVSTVSDIKFNRTFKDIKI